MTQTETAPPSSADARSAALAYAAGPASAALCLWRFSARPFVRFHAWQSLLLWVLTGGLMLGTMAVPIVGSALAAALFGAGLVLTAFLLVRAWSGRWTVLPLLGDIALEQSVPRR